MSVVAISADTASDSKTYANDNGYSFPLLRDPTAQVMEAYGVRMVDSDIAVPATFLVRPDGTVAWSYVGETQRDFADLEAMLSAVKATSSAL